MTEVQFWTSCLNFVLMRLVASAHVLRLDDLIVKLAAEDAELDVQLQEKTAHGRHAFVVFLMERFGNLFAGKHRVEQITLSLSIVLPAKL